MFWVGNNDEKDVTKIIDSNLPALSTPIILAKKADTHPEPELEEAVTYQ